MVASKQILLNNLKVGKNLSTGKNKIAILVVSNQIGQKTQDQFVWNIKASEPKLPFDLFLGSHSNMNETFRKTTILNDMLRETLDKYDCVVQTDIDMLIPPNLIRITLEHSKVDNLCYHCNYRYVEENEFIKWKTNGWKFIDWVSLVQRPCFKASGSWNGMNSKTWRKSNGFCEAIFNLGGPDTEFFRRCIKLGIDWKQDNGLALSHINHPRRRKIAKQGKKNLEIAKRFPIDYNWLYHREKNICATNIIKIGVN
jgi:hypothetical protein